MYIVNQEITVTWVIPPTATPLLLADYDISYIPSCSEGSYTDGAVLSYVPPSAVSSGVITYALTTNSIGLFMLRLAVGSGVSFQVLEDKTFWVFPDCPTSAPSTTILSANQEPGAPALVVGFGSSFTPVVTGPFSAPILTPDGLTMYLVSISQTIYEHSLSVAFDISTAVSTGVTKSLAEPGGDTWLSFKSDGLRLIVTSLTRTMWEYSLSTAWDITSITYTTNTFNMGTQFGAAQSNQSVVNSTGTRVYALKVLPSGVTVYQYNLSTPWDVSTASYSSSYFSALIGNLGYGLGLAPDDRQFFIADNDGDVVQEYIMGTKDDITTATSLARSTDFSNEFARTRGLSIASDSSLIMGDQDNPYKIYRYITQAMLD